MKRFLMLPAALFLTGAAFAQAAPALPDLAAPRGCTAELRGNRPKIYIANFYVTYGKPDMGKAIGDFIAEKFEADGRLEVISRSVINEEMKPLLREKKLKAERYLEQTLALAAGKQADCVIFGRIARNKKGDQISFLVRMAAVETGQNLRKVDTEVARGEAMGFLENVGDSFVTYFTTAVVPVAQVPVELPSSREKKFYAAGSAIGLLPFGFVSNGFTMATGGSAEFGYKGLHKDLFFGVNSEYLYYFKKNDNFISLYGAAAYGLAGYEWLTFDKLHFQLVLYGGYQYGKLTGAIESTEYGYGMFMSGLRAVIDIGPRFGLLTEARYILAIAGTTKISSAAFSLGGQWRF